MTQKIAVSVFFGNAPPFDFTAEVFDGEIQSCLKRYVGVLGAGGFVWKVGDFTKSGQNVWQGVIELECGDFKYFKAILTGMPSIARSRCRVDVTS